jgi:hypothetical protein
MAALDFKNSRRLPGVASLAAMGVPSGLLELISDIFYAESALLCVPYSRNLETGRACWKSPNCSQ